MPRTTRATRGSRAINLCSRHVLRRTAVAAAAGLLITTCLSAGGAMAQAARELDRLLAERGAPSLTRGFDLETRASKRYAVVIGNSDYVAIPDLPNAVADARAMSEFFKEQGYDVHTHLDITKRGFEDVLRRILFDADKDTEVVVFFAGHGFQIGSENYLVPVDADLDSVYDVPFEAVSLGSLVGIVGARARLQVVILDSCRENPFAGASVLTRIGNELREVRTGFSSQAAPLNSMLIFSTAPGSVAFDGEGENSPFTAAFIEEVSEAPDALVKEVFEGVRRLVFEKTMGRQVPWDSSTLVEPASFGLGTALSRPIRVSSVGEGAKRGLARLVPPPAAQGAEPVAERRTVIEADFVPEVQIGFTLREALDLGPTDSVTVTAQPRTGRLVLTDQTGLQRNILGDALSSADVDRLLLVNNSVQIPATSLADGVIDDTIGLSVNGTEERVQLNLRPHDCDFEAGDHLDPDGMGLTRYANEIRPEFALAACRAAVETDPENGRFHYQLGRALVALRQTDEAKEAFERAKELGHTRAWHALGNAILNESREAGGASNPKASEEVLQLYAQGVERGDPYAFYSLGRQFMRFGGSDAIEIEGYDLMMRALEVGHTFAMNELGYFYLDADSEYFDPERGLRYLRESASRNDIYGFNNMGLVHLDGLGNTPVDDAAAFEMFRKAAEGGHPNAPFNLGRMYRDGRAPGGRDPVVAVEWFAEGLERGDAFAGGSAAHLIATRGAPGYDMFDAAVFAAKAAALVNQSAAQPARELLESFDGQAVAGGTQELIRALGGAVEVDGDFGPGSKAALDEVLVRNGGGAAADDPVDRIVQLASLVWKASEFRVDLY
jgi:TPR repeat protein